MPIPCPPVESISIIKRSAGQSPVAAAAYQSGERLHSDYDNQQKYYPAKCGIVHAEILLPPNAPPEFQNRNTLWNSVEKIEKQKNSQLARRIVVALPREFSHEQQIELLREYCRGQFVEKGIIVRNPMNRRYNDKINAGHSVVRQFLYRSKSMQTKAILEAYPDVLTAKDIQSILHISRSNAYSLINSGELKILHIGKRKLALKAELIRWMERNSF